MTAKRAGGLLEEALTHSVIGAFYDVHRALGLWRSLAALPLTVRAGQ